MKNQKALRKVAVALALGGVFATTIPAQAYPTVLAVDNLQVQTNSIQSGIQEIEKYGNIDLLMTPEEFEAKGFEFEDTVTITVNGKVYDDVPYVRNFQNVANGDYLIANIKGKMVVAINMGDFAKDAGIAEKEKLADGGYVWKDAEGNVLSSEALQKVNITITPKEKKAYHILTYKDYTNSRADYASDAIFANFRNVRVGKLGKDVFFRSASPINPAIGRSGYADKLAKEAGIRTVMNLADKNADIEAYAREGLSPYYKSLYDDGQVIALNLGVDYKAQDFKASLARAMKFFADNEAPYLVHCKEGKDRCGFTSALIECLMGASYDEVADDYLETFCNYYHLEKGSEDYETVRERNIDRMLMFLTGTEDPAEVRNANLQRAAEKYLLEGGLTEADLAKVKENLGTDLENRTEITCKVKSVDKYGDVITTVTSQDLKALHVQVGDMLKVAFDNQELEIPFVTLMTDVADGENLALNAKGNLMLALKSGNFNETQGITEKDLESFEMVVSIGEKGGYLDQYEIMHLERTNNREDYASDAIFANFRNVELGHIGKNAFFRTGSPINNKYGRAAYADKLAQENGIKCIMNLADDDKKIQKHMAKADFNSPY